MLTFLVTLALAAPAAKQSSFDIDKNGSSSTLKWSFVDESGSARKVSASLSSAAIEADNGTPRQFPKADAAKAQVKAIEKYAAKPGGPKIKAKATKSGGVSISMCGKSGAKLQTAMTEAKAAAKVAFDDWLRRHGYTRLRNDAISPDHATLADQYADDVAPVASALAVGTTDERSFVARTLRFVQAIPYEAKKGGGDTGYRRPLSVLARNKGDCDSKVALFLALVRSQYPALDSTVVIIPNHAFAGVTIEPLPGERTFSLAGTRYLALEPVGPAAVEVGKVSGRSGWHLFWGSNEKRALPASADAPVEPATTSVIEAPAAN